MSKFAFDSLERDAIDDHLEDGVPEINPESQSIGEDIKISEGDDLAQEILDALADGKSSIEVAPHEDGTPWSWSTDLTIDPTNYDLGFRLQVSDHTRIVYQGSGTALTLDAAGDLDTQLNNDGSGGALVEIIGGQWDLSDGGDWLNLVDCYRPEICPKEVVGDATSTSTAIHLENSGTWSEGGLISGRLSNFGIGVDSSPAADPNDSFSDFRLEDLFIGKIRDIGVRMKGGWVGSSLKNVFAFAGTDGATGFYLDGNHLGSSWRNANMEDGSDSHANLTYIETGSNYQNPPVIVNSHDYTDNGIVYGDTSHFVNRIESTTDQLKMGNPNGARIETDHVDDKHLFKDNNNSVRLELDTNGNARFNGANLYEVANLKLDQFPFLLSLTGRTSDPGAANSGQAEIWYRSDTGAIKAIDDAGTTITLGTF